jgi:GxxExxY protein
MPRVKLLHEELTHSIIGAFFDVYYELGFGFLEHVYVSSLTRELHRRGHQVGREVSVPIYFKGEEVARQRLDMVVGAKIVIETKSNERLQPEAVRQLTGYLKATNLEVGLLLHFGPGPRFIRVVATNSAQRSPKSSSPPNPPLARLLPREPLDIDASDTGRGGREI